MTTVFKVLCFVLLLSSCANTRPQDGDLVDTETPAKSSSLSLRDKVQTLVVNTQEMAISSLPGEISDFKTTEAVADREKNQRGAGFTRVYAIDDAVVTVFVYNNQEFGMIDEITPAEEGLMEKHLQEFQSMQDSGLYTNVKPGNKKVREFRWRGIRYQVLEVDVNFNQRDEAKRSFLVLGVNKELMSYVRIRFTYPKSRQSEISSKQNVFTRIVFVALNDFAESQKPKSAE